MGLSTY